MAAGVCRQHYSMNITLIWYVSPKTLINIMELCSVKIADALFWIP